MVSSALDFRSESRWFEPGLCRRVVSLDKKLYFTITQNSQSEAVIKKIPVGVGVSVLSFLSRDHTK